MKAKSFFTDSELELALTLVSETLDDSKKATDELSIYWSVGNKYAGLKDKIDIYYSNSNK